MFPGSQTPRRPAFSPTNRSILLCCIGIAFFIAILALAPTRNPATPAPSSTDTKVVHFSDDSLTAFKEVVNSIAKIDALIVEEERIIDGIRRGRNTEDQAIIREWHKHQAILAQMKQFRASDVIRYNLLASEVPLTIPVIEELEKHGLPQSISVR